MSHYSSPQSSSQQKRATTKSTDTQKNVSLFSPPENSHDSPRSPKVILVYSCKIKIGKDGVRAANIITTDWLMRGTGKQSQRWCMCSCDYIPQFFCALFFSKKNPCRYCFYPISSTTTLKDPAFQAAGAHMHTNTTWPSRADCVVKNTHILKTGFYWNLSKTSEI